MWNLTEGGNPPFLPSCSKVRLAKAIRLHTLNDGAIFHGWRNMGARYPNGSFIFPKELTMLNLSVNMGTSIPFPI